MKFSLKTLSLAVALAASATGSSAAPIDTGATTGNGGLFFNIWDTSSSSVSKGSYTRNLNTTFDAFEAQLLAAGNIDRTFVADSKLTDWLGTVADKTRLRWNVLAFDGSGDNRILTTFTTVPPTTRTDDVIRSAAQIKAPAFLDASGGVNAGLASTDSVTLPRSFANWAGNTLNASTNIGGSLNFSNAGTTANQTFATSLNLLNIFALSSGVDPSTYTQYLDGGNKVGVWFSADNTLHIAAVPEPESYAMLLAGLGMLGFMARRRLNNRV